LSGAKEATLIPKLLGGQMNPRYFVRFTHREGSDVQSAEVLIGRFRDLESAELNAQIQFSGAEGVEITGVRQETHIESLVYGTTRFAIRTFRISCGVVLAVLAYGWSSAGSIGDIPFDSLTLNMLGTALGSILLFIVALYVSWEIAFGEGPEK
jgi:hypothetical protein